ncbi:MAG: Crp/Fnr family transcriptional regulator [Betaproteobacteria bacterium]|nr:Crp/Fnr family transcriptional regulator [Betaproteobacteria bacterium]
MQRQAVTADVLQEEILRAIAARGGVRVYARNSVIINEGERADTFFIILSGRVKVYGSDDSGNEIIYSVHGAGEYVGEMSLESGIRTASVMTMEETACSVVSGTEFKNFIVEQPAFALHLIHKLIRRAREATEGIKNLALLDVYGRVCTVLVGLAEESNGVLRVTERLTQQDIADRVGASREMVSRIFKELISGGYVAQDAGRWTILKKLPARW